MKDELTGLLSLPAFQLLVEHELIVARRLGRIDTLLVIDVTRQLEVVNEDFGQSGGDETLRAIARLLTRTARESDIIGRVGAGEFAIFALGCEGDALAKRLAASVMRAGETAVEATDRELSVEIGIRITEAGPGEAFEELMARVNPAIRGAK